MAVTVLQHMKEAPKFKPQHLHNAIKYILDVRNDGAKTDFGKWVGGNVGLEFNEIFWNFMNTKKVLEKLDGRQGYHFVISFNKEENVSAETCFNVLEDFCKNYLGDEYDYVFAVHTDKEHMHGHIIFNSVNRITAKKYRYEKGDWEKYIQPVTDQIAQTYNLLPLTYEKERIGVSHAKWAEKNLRKLNWKTIIRADVDYAIKNSSTWEEFLQNMKAMNYALDLRGYSTKHESNYITFCYKGDDGKIHKKRSYTLTSGESDDYSVQNIVKKIKSKTLDEPYYEVISDVMKNNVNMRLGQLSSSVKNTKTYYRMYQAVNYYKLPNPYAESKHMVRKDMLRIEKLIEECMYLKKNPSLTFDKLDKRLLIVEDELKKAYIERKSLREFDWSSVKI